MSLLSLPGIRREGSALCGKGRASYRKAAGLKSDNGQWFLVGRLVGSCSSGAAGSPGEFERAGAGRPSAGQGSGHLGSLT